jgi:hypothetical protein
MLHRTLVPLLALSLLPACLMTRDTTGDPLPAEAVASLEPGRTTAGQALDLLGAPSEVVQLGRRSAYRYEFVQAKLSGFTLLVVAFLNTDTHSDRLWLFFDEADLLTHVGASLNGDRAEYAMPWSELDH